MSREYRCSGICLGNPGDPIGPRAMCRLAEDVKNHATCTNNPNPPKGHRILTSDVIKIEVTSEKISVFTRSGSHYWMPNGEGAGELILTDKKAITDFLGQRAGLPREETLS